jgi:probable F420-dependent oxidoreductase
MKFDANLNPAAIGDAATSAAALESAGFNRVWCAEVGHDPFLPLALAATSTSSVELATGIAVAFARSPMTVAYTAWDLQQLSGGRFVLGLGSQVKPHIEKRYSMEWSAPAVRMAEYIEALRAIWHSWQTGERLNFRGEFYRHTLMTPFFAPAPLSYAAPRIVLAAVNPARAAVAGRHADGIVVHPFVTVSYLRDVLLPAAHAGRASDAAPFEVSLSGFVAAGATTEEVGATRELARMQVAFYASTPSYSAVLAHHGWEALGTELHALSVAGDWANMAALVTDDVLAEFCLTLPPASSDASNAARDRTPSGDRPALEEAVRARFGGLVTRFATYTP